MRNVQMNADEKKVNEPVLSKELRPFCACRGTGTQYQCTHFSACSYWRKLNARTVRNSWVDRFLRAFVATKVQGRVFNETPEEGVHYHSILFTPFEGKNIMKDLNRVIYSLQDKYSHPMALYVEGYKMREIAEILEISLISVLLRIAYARRRLIALLKNQTIISLKISPALPSESPVK